MPSTEFAEKVRKNWQSPLHVGRIALEEAKNNDSRFRPQDDQIERALEIGMIIAETREAGPEAFLEKYEEMALTALVD